MSLFNPKRPHDPSRPFDPSTPLGSPLDPFKFPAPVPMQSPPFVPPLAPAAIAALPPPVAIPQASIERTNTALPSSPPRTRVNMFDKEHLSATLAAMAQGFASSDNFAGGLSAAAGNIASLSAAQRAALVKQIEIGGPDSAFEIITDPQTGEKSFKPIAAVQDYLAQREAAKHKPTGKDTIDLRARTAYAVSQLPPEQQQAAWEGFIADSKALGYDLGLPAEFNPDQARAMIDQGSPVATQEAADARLVRDRAAQAERDRNFALRSANSASTISNRAAANRRAERKLNAPPSKRRGSGGTVKLPAGFNWTS